MLSTKEEMFPIDDKYKRHEYMTPAEEAVQYGKVWFNNFVTIFPKFTTKYYYVQIIWFQVPKIVIQRPTPSESEKRTKGKLTKFK